MGIGLCALALALQPQLSFASGKFTIKDGDDTLTVPLFAAEPEPVFRGTTLDLRVDGVLVTFDDKGLGIRYGNRGGYTRLAYMPDNPALFDSEESSRIAALVASGERSKSVSAVSGFEVVDDRIFLLLRWDDKANKPWLEVLVDLDTSGDAPKVNYLGRFGGFSYAQGKVSDELHSHSTRLFSPVRAALGLGLGSYDIPTSTSKFVNLGPHVEVVRKFGARFYTLTSTSYGLKQVGVIDPISERMRTVMETRGEIVPSALTSALIVKENGVSSLFAFVSGSRFQLPADYGCAQTPYGVLVWSPKAGPKEASLLETDGFSAITVWKRR